MVDDTGFESPRCTVSPAVGEAMVMFSIPFTTMDVSSVNELSSPVFVAFKYIE